jgi:phosphatidylinositol alpha-1,6-mannosyltransferase
VSAVWSSIGPVGHYRRVDVPRTLLVTNDFPPRVGGIQRTLEALWQALPADRVAVWCPAWDGGAAYDAEAPFPVYRQPEGFLWPSPSVADRIERAARDFEAEVLLFGATYPLALLGPRLACRGLPYLTAAHGFEYWLSIAPGAHTLMRRATSRASRVPVLCSAFIARTVRTAVPAAVPVSVLYPGADTERFRPDLDTDDIRASLGIGSRPLVVCVSRLVARKGQDVLIDAMPAIAARVPEAALLIVGGGPAEPRLRAKAARLPGVVFFAGQVAEEELPRHYAVGDVFAMPCRTRLAGLEVEGWGNVFIEAAACGKPVVVGDSGGARESLVDGATGIVVDGRRAEAVADAVGSLLADPARAAAMGAAGRERVLRSHRWPDIAAELAGWLREAATTTP